jgi:hypothetical protein
MNKVDDMVMRLLMNFPTLFHNRFEAFSEIMTNSCFCWTSDGNIGYISRLDVITPEQMLKRFEDGVAEAQAKFDKDTADAPYMVSFSLERLIAAKRELADATFIADHIEVYASTWCGCGYDEINKWFGLAERNSFIKYGVVNNRPANIDEEWRLAIYGWFNHMLPTANSYMGWYDEKEKVWKSVKRHREMFEWLRAKYDEYQSAKERRLAQDFAADVEKVLAVPEPT